MRKAKARSNIGIHGRRVMPGVRRTGSLRGLPMLKAPKSHAPPSRRVRMVNQAEVRESHEQFSAAWSLYARCSGAGEVVDLDGLRVANARQPWFLMNAALLTEPVRSQTHLAARAHAALEYFGH